MHVCVMNNLFTNKILNSISNMLFFWLLDPVHGYSARGAYHFLTTSGVPVDRYLVDNV